ncbi:hypothetical protein PMIN06_006450 [Paraphaeosphaeria minitans]
MDTLANNPGDTTATSADNANTIDSIIGVGNVNHRTAGSGTMGNAGVAAEAMAAGTADACIVMKKLGETTDDTKSAFIDGLAYTKDADNAALGDAWSRPVPIYYDMVLPAKKLLWVIATKKYNIIPGYTIQPDTPTPLEFPNTSWLKGYEVIDKRFVIGWNKLPVELKLMIVACDTKLNGDIKRRNKIHNPGNQGGWRRILHYEKMTPEFGALATQVSYEKHHFRIEGAEAKTSYGLRSVDTMFFPKIEINKFIKMLHIRVPLDALGRSRLQRLADGEFGFKNLKSLIVEVAQTIYYIENKAFLESDVFIDFITHKPARFKLSMYKPVVFKHAGAVKYTCSLLHAFWSTPMEPNTEDFVQEMEDSLRKEITFAP